MNLLELDAVAGLADTASRPRAPGLRPLPAEAPRFEHRCRSLQVSWHGAWLTEFGAPLLSIVSATKAAVRNFARSFSAALLPGQRPQLVDESPLVQSSSA